MAIHQAFSVPPSDLDFEEAAPVKKLTIAGGKVYACNAASDSALAEPFPFTPANPD